MNTSNFNSDVNFNISNINTLTNEELLSKLSESPNQLINFFDVMCNKYNQWYTKKTDYFDKIFKKLEEFNSDCKLDQSQITKITDITKLIYSSINKNELKKEISIFFQ